MAVTPDMNQIATVMSQLQHNYSQMAQNWFNIFYNPVAQDVTITFYDEVGNYETYTVPNRAKDLSHIHSGSGNPEGVLKATVGDVYQDLENGEAYLKKTGESYVGWVKFINASDLDGLLRKGSSNPEGNITGGMGDLFIDKTGVALYIKTTATGNTGWKQIDSNLPEQSGQAGKYLMTNGTDAVWSTIKQSPDTDGVTVSINSDEELQAIGIIDNNTSSAMKYWTGTKAQYDAISVKDSNTFYNVTDDTPAPLEVYSKAEVYTKEEVYSRSESDDRYVNITGDTMTGDLTISKSSSPSVILKSTTLDRTQTTAPSAIINGGQVLLNDKYNEYTGACKSYLSTSNVMVTEISARRNLNSTDYVNTFRIGVDDTGKSVFSNPQIIASYIDTTTATSGYILWSNGYCEQWGQFTSQGYQTTTTITFLKTYKDTNYQVLLSSNYQQSTGSKSSSCGWSSKSTTQVTVYSGFEDSNPTITWRTFGFLASDQY